MAYFICSPACQCQDPTPCRLNAGGTPAVQKGCHCEERRDEAIPFRRAQPAGDYFASLAMTRIGLRAGRPRSGPTPAPLRRQLFWKEAGSRMIAEYASLLRPAPCRLNAGGTPAAQKRLERGPVLVQLILPLNTSSKRILDANPEAVRKHQQARRGQKRKKNE